MAANSQPNDTENMEASTADEVEDCNPEESMEDEEEEAITVQVGTTYSCKRQDGTYHDAEVLKTRMNKRVGREEFYVRYVGLNCRQNEWVDKTRLVMVEPVAETEEPANGTEMDEPVAETEETENGTELVEPVAETEEPANGTEMDEPVAETEEPTNGTEQETPENESLCQGQPAEEDEPAPKKMKLDPPVNSSVVSDDLAEELTCLLCNDFFENPVVVECGHNFCRSCLDSAWEGQDSFVCPDCKEVITDKRYTCNRALANLVKKTVGAAAVPTTSANSLVSEKARPPEKCVEHDERLKLYCKDDGDLGCVICRESLKHTNHNFLPILDAVGVYRTELSSIVSPLEDALKVAEEMAKQQNMKIEKHKTSMQEYKGHIEAEFKKLHDLLREREEKLLGKLHVEGGSLLMEMEENMAKMEDNIESIKESIAAASEKLNDTDSISFLTDIKTFIQKCQEQKTEALSSENSLINRELDQETYLAPIEFSMTEEVKVEQPIAQKPKEVWIIGNILVTRAAQIAKDRPYGQTLGLEGKGFTVRWMTRVFMKWRHMLPQLNNQSLALGQPHVVFIHLGSSELAHTPLIMLLRSAKADFLTLSSLYPHTKFIWSAVMPRKLWQVSKVEEHRQKFNLKCSGFARENGIQVVLLEEMEQMLQRKFTETDYIENSDEVVEMFTLEMMKSINKAIYNGVKQEHDGVKQESD